MANTCLMLAVITLYYFPRLGYCFFLFVANFKQVLSFDYFCYFSRFHQHHYFHYYRFILFFTTNVVITSVVTISAFFSLLLVYFVYYLYMVVGLFYVSDKNTSWFIFYILLLTLGIYTVHCCKFDNL